MKKNIDICVLDLNDDDVKEIEDKGFNVYNGSAGKNIEITYSHDTTKYCLLNYDIPTNLHEYEILIINMNDRDTIPFNFEDHQRKQISDNAEIKLKVSKPTNIFDPKPLSYNILNKKIIEFSSKPSIIITFAAAEYEINYFPVQIEDGGYKRSLDTIKYSNYSFIKDSFLRNGKNGKIFNIIIKNGVIRDFLLTLEDIEYYQTFYYPEIWDPSQSKRIKDPNFLPLLENNTNEIISYVYSFTNTLSFVFPDIKDKGKFLSRFLTEVCPQFLPDLYQNNDEIKWLEDQQYWLPNYSNLLNDMKQERERYDQQIIKIEAKIEQNKKQFQFLNDLITESGSKLVDAVIEMLEFLEFKTVLKVDDENNNELLEEDIRLEESDKILVIEVKGIGGTSKDSECSQISKIRLRRMKEKNSTNIYALYIVNNERYKPPHFRTNPPFNPTQIQDSLNDDRGLLTTWDLYNLYKDIINGFISKQEARKIFFDYGLINFRKNFIYLGKIEKTYNNDFVASVNLSENLQINVGENVYIEKNGEIYERKILNIQQNKEELMSAKTGLTGLKFDKPIERNSNIYKK